MGELKKNRIEDNKVSEPYTLHPRSCILHPTPYTLHPTPYTLHPAPYTLHQTPCTLHPTPYTEPPWARVWRFTWVPLLSFY